MTLFTIDDRKCTRDGLCAAACPLKLINMDQNGPDTVTDAELFCIRCGHCTAVCPRGALALQTMPLERCPPFRHKWRLTAPQIEQLLKGRRSVRSYKSEAVSRDVIAQIIDTARFAPSIGNSQSLQWTVVLDAEEVHRIASATMDWMQKSIHRTESPWITALAESWESGEDPICRFAPHLIMTHVPKERAQIAAVDGPIALTYFELAALPHQISTCWAGYVAMAASRSPAVHSALRLPEGHQFIGGMMFGYSNVKYYRIPMRNEAHTFWRE